MESSNEENRLKEALKAAIFEVLEERRDFLRDLVEEAVEDVALVRAIDDGQRTEVIGRDEVFEILEDEA